MVHFGDQQVFPECDDLHLPAVPGQKPVATTFHVAKVARPGRVAQESKAGQGDVSADEADTEEWNFVVGPGAGLFERLSEMPVKLEDVAERMSQGIRTSANKSMYLNFGRDEDGLD